MKADFMERVALVNGWFGCWFTILASAFIGALGGLVIGAMAGGILSSMRKVEFESDQVSGWLIVAFGLLGSILAGSWCRRRLTKLKNEENEQDAALK
jgi:NhaP-type Na+/H+ or K+/H+ antiporter